MGCSCSVFTSPELAIEPFAALLVEGIPASSPPMLACALGGPREGSAVDGIGRGGAGRGGAGRGGAGRGGGDSSNHCSWTSCQSRWVSSTRLRPSSQLGRGLCSVRQSTAPLRTSTNSRSLGQLASPTRRVSFATSLTVSAKARRSVSAPLTPPMRSPVMQARLAIPPRCTLATRTHAPTPGKSGCGCMSAASSYSEAVAALAANAAGRRFVANRALRSTREKVGFKAF